MTPRRRLLAVEQLVVAEDDNLVITVLEDVKSRIHVLTPTDAAWRRSEYQVAAT